MVVVASNFRKYEVKGWGWTRGREEWACGWLIRFPDVCIIRLSLMDS